MSVVVPLEQELLEPADHEGCSCGIRCIKGYLKFRDQGCIPDSVGEFVMEGCFRLWKGATTRMSCSLIFNAEHFPLSSFGNIYYIKPGIIPPYVFVFSFK